jgi:hypothetical protein
MSDSTTSSPLNPRELLDAATAADNSGAAIARRGSKAIATMSIAIAVLVALFLLAVVYIFPTDNLPLIIASVVLYGIGIFTSVMTYNRLRVSTGPGATHRYMVGLALTMSLFAIGVALTFVVDLATPLFWVPFAVLVAVPLTVTGLTGSRR